MVEVESAEPYPENYDELVAQVAEENESGYTPPLKTKVENIQAYDTVFFGFPTWDMQLPPPMKSFLRERDLSGKNVVPFNTNGGYGVGSSFQTIEDRCPNSDVLEGFSTRGGSETDGIYLAIKGERREEVHAEVADWLQNVQV
jgi:flavodoxin